jgi:hypothetical protein
MEIPLVLSERRDGALVVSVPTAYRIVTAVVLAVLALALLPGPNPPGAIGWIVLIFVALAVLYEDRWIIDPSAGRILHRTGLVFLARRTSILLGDVARLRVAPFVRGTVPGSAEEAEENAAALAGDRPDDSGRRRLSPKRRYLSILIETTDGTRYFVDANSARRAGALKARASRIAAACGVQMIEG